MIIAIGRRVLPTLPGFAEVLCDRGAAVEEPDVRACYRRGFKKAFAGWAYEPGNGSEYDEAFTRGFMAGDRARDGGPFLSAAVALLQPGGEMRRTA